MLIDQLVLQTILILGPLKWLKTLITEKEKEIKLLKFSENKRNFTGLVQFRVPGFPLPSSSRR